MGSPERAAIYLSFQARGATADERQSDASEMIETLRERGLLDLLVLDVPAQCETDEKLVEVDRLGALISMLPVLARDEGALDVEL